MERNRLIRALACAACALALVGAAATRVIQSGEAELAASTAALDAGDPREAVVRARRAAGWYAPGAPHVDAAYQRLAALGRAAEAHRRDDIALLAWRSMRSAAIDTRWLVSPRRDDIALANAEIARLMAKRPDEAEPDATIRQAQLQKLLRHEPPARAWAIALCASFALAALGLALWARGVGEAAGRLARRFFLGGPTRHGRWGVALTACGVALWLLSLWRA